jgi:hypothetical protein
MAIHADAETGLRTIVRHVVTQHCEQSNTADGITTPSAIPKVRKVATSKLTCTHDTTINTHAALVSPIT